MCLIVIHRLHCAINATKACAVFLVHSILPLCPSPSCSASLASPGLLSEGVVMYLRDRERGRLGGEEVCSILLLSPLCPTSLSSPPATEVDCYLPDGLIVVSPLFSVSSRVSFSEKIKCIGRGYLSLQGECRKGRVSSALPKFSDCLRSCCCHLLLLARLTGFVLLGPAVFRRFRVRGT